MTKQELEFVAQAERDAVSLSVVLTLACETCSGSMGVGALGAALTMLRLCEGDIERAREGLEIARDIQRRVNRGAH